MTRRHTPLEMLRRYLDDAASFSELFAAFEAARGSSKTPDPLVVHVLYVLGDASSMDWDEDEIKDALARFAPESALPTQHAGNNSLVDADFMMQGLAGSFGSITVTGNVAGQGSRTAVVQQGRIREHA